MRPAGRADVCGDGTARHVLLHSLVTAPRRSRDPLFPEHLSSGRRESFSRPQEEAAGPSPFRERPPCPRPVGGCEDTGAGPRDGKVPRISESGHLGRFGQKHQVWVSCESRQWPRFSVRAAPKHVAYPEPPLRPEMPPRPGPLDPGARREGRCHRSPVPSPGSRTQDTHGLSIHQGPPNGTEAGSGERPHPTRAPRPLAEASRHSPNSRAIGGQAQGEVSTGKRRKEAQPPSSSSPFSLSSSCVCHVPLQSGAFRQPQRPRRAPS